MILEFPYGIKIGMKSEDALNILEKQGYSPKKNVLGNNLSINCISDNLVLFGEKIQGFSINTKNNLVSGCCYRIPNNNDLYNKTIIKISESHLVKLNGNIHYFYEDGYNCSIIEPIYGNFFYSITASDEMINLYIVRSIQENTKNKEDAKINKKKVCKINNDTWLKVGLIVIIFVIGYLFALNNRYQYTDKSRIKTDKWTGAVYYIANDGWEKVN